MLCVNCLILGLKAFLIPALISLGVLPSICDALKKYGLFSYFDQWFIDFSFATYHFTLKTIVYRKIRDFEANAWDTFSTDHLDLYIAQGCLENTSPRKFWSISEQFPDFVCCLASFCDSKEVRIRRVAKSRKNKSKGVQNLEITNTRGFSTECDIPRGLES